MNEEEGDLMSVHTRRAGGQYSIDCVIKKNLSDSTTGNVSGRGNNLEENGRALSNWCNRSLVWGVRPRQGTKVFPSISYCSGTCFHFWILTEPGADARSLLQWQRKLSTWVETSTKLYPKLNICTSSRKPRRAQCLPLD